MFPLAAASIVGVRSHDRRPEEGPDDGLGALEPSVGAALMARRGSDLRVGVAALRKLLRGPDFDVVLAFIAFAALLIDPVVSHQVKELTPLAAALALVTAVPLVFRRRHPLGVLDRGAAAAGVPGRVPSRPDRSCRRDAGRFHRRT